MARINNTTLSDGIEDFTTYSDYKTAVYIWTVMPPALIIVGTTGNILSMIVLTRKPFRSSSTALYLTFLAFSDLLVLYSGLLRQWLVYLVDVDIRHISAVTCKLDIWLVYSSLMFSAWILMLVTLERVISVWSPYKVKIVCSRKSAVISIMSIGIIIFGLNSHLLYGMGFREIRDELGAIIEVRKCVYIDDSYAALFLYTWPWIDLGIYCVLPFVAISMGNTIILYKIIKSRKSVLFGSVSSNMASYRKQNQASMNAILFTISIVFLLSTSPISVYAIIYPVSIKNANGLKIAKMELWWAIVNMFMYTNNSINFILYCLSGTKFRQETVRLFCWKRTSSAITHIHSASGSAVSTDTTLDVSTL